MTTRYIIYPPTGVGDLEDLQTQIIDLRARLDDQEKLINHHGSQHLTIGGSDPTTYYWRAYTPTLSASTTNPTLGSGAVAKGRWLRDGLEITVAFRIMFGSSGVNPGSGTYRISLPTAYNDRFYTAQAWSLGTARLTDNNGTDTTAIIGPGSDNTYVILFTTGSAGASVNASTPWTWAASDAIAGTITYMAAKG